MLVNRRTIRIEWGDCDPAGIVFYPRYFEWFDACSTGLFEAAGFLGSPQEFVRVAILRGFHDSVDDDEFEVGRGQPFGFQQEVSQVLVAAAAVDQ